MHTSENPTSSSLPIPPAPPWFSTQLATYLTREDVVVEDRQIKALTAHAEWVSYWNTVTNLTALRRWEAIMEKHYLDSLIPAVRWLPRSGDALDIGSGAGFPGVPIHILFPSLTMVLCEVKRKKVAFLKTFLAHVPLPSIQVFHGDWQQLVRREEKQFHLITCRALAIGESEIALLVRQALVPGGTLAIWSTPRTAAPRIPHGCGEVTVYAKSYRLLSPEERVIWLVKRVAGKN